MTIRFELRATGKPQLAPLHVSLSDGRKFRKRHVTQIYIKPEAWDSRSASLKKRYPLDENEKVKINSEMFELHMFLTNAYLEDRQNGTVNSDWLDIHMKRYYNTKSTACIPDTLALNDLFDRFVSNRDIGPERKHLYNRICQMLIHYEKISGISALNMNVHDLEKFYHSVVNQKDMVLWKKSCNYISLIFKALRTFYGWCVKTGILKNSPFDNFRIPSENYGSPIYLDKEDISRIMNVNLKAYPLLEVQRDIFIFQCNIGCRVGDMIGLQKKDIVKGILTYIPRKTIKTASKTISIPLNRTAQGIVNKYKDYPGDKLLPFITPRNYNVAIKKILTYAGVDYLVTRLDPKSGQAIKSPINKIASSHMARRTFVGNIYKHVKDPALVSSMTGHSEGSRVFCRYREIDIDMKREMVKILEE